MSVATEFAPIVFIPERARRTSRPLAAVIPLHRPSAASVAAPVRLTRRGVRVLAAAVASLAVVLVAAAWLSAPSSSAASTPVPESVTVRSGDTLWSIATRIAPNRDPRAEVDQLQQLNRVGDAALVAGQILRTR